MKQIIRWPGIIAFVAISALIAFVVLFFLDFWIKTAATKGLEQATGAEVNIANVEHTLTPFSVTLQGIQLTDPAKPSHNQVLAKTVKADIELSPLLSSKVIINNLTVEGVQFDQARQRDGKVYIDVDTPEIEADSGAEEGKPLPSVDDILANSPLRTTKAAEDAKLAYEKHEASLKAKYEALPSKDKLADYKKRFKALTETDYKNPAELAKAKQKFDAFKAELKADKAKIDDFKQASKLAKADLSTAARELKDAPNQDYEQLKGLVAGDEAALNDVTQMVFGDKAEEWGSYLLTAYDMLAPMLKSKEKEAELPQHGKWITFDDIQPLPDLLIKQAKISVAWQQEVLDSQWTDITYQHEKIGRPTRFNVNSASSALWQSLIVKGDFTFTQTGLVANQNWNVKGVTLENTELLAKDKLSSTLLNGLLGSQGSLTVKDEQIDGRGTVDLSALKLDSTGSNNITNIIADSLNSLQNLSITSNVSGEYSQPAFSFRSDLDKQLSKAILNSVGSKYSGKLDKLKSGLTGKASGALGENNAQLAQLANWEKLADGDLSNIQEMLQGQLSSILDKKRDKLKDKLKNKLFGG